MKLINIKSNCNSSDTSENNNDKLKYFNNYIIDVRECYETKDLSDVF